MREEKERGGITEGGRGEGERRFEYKSKVKI